MTFEADFRRLRNTLDLSAIVDRFERGHFGAGL